MFGIRQSIFSLEARDVSSKAVQGVFNGNTLKARPLRSLEKLWALQIDNAFIYLFRLKDLKRRPWPRRGEGVGTERNGTERSGAERSRNGRSGAAVSRERWVRAPPGVKPRCTRVGEHGGGGRAGLE